MVNIRSYGGNRSSWCVRLAIRCIRSHHKSVINESQDVRPCCFGFIAMRSSIIRNKFSHTVMHGVSSRWLTFRLPSLKLLSESQFPSSTLISHLSSLLSDNNHKPAQHCTANKSVRNEHSSIMECKIHLRNDVIRLSTVIAEICLGLVSDAWSKTRKVL